ncbi:Allantoicase [Tilletiaria anomala UBC 951]|uniref:Allantoicase n=1 Tax=Tilletiaria anomala (strain ATCC 24038 / CBS 436.72 / UBC 951) TaxID=1037660 RepID=A0A066WR54_TILAU|nr:Allantoicase [Tilletiaria anomala UBC 951]KDN53484.1 Allantoicase [Tilletiaria anomala UBC 951]
MPSPAFEQVPLENFDRVLGATSTEVSSVALGGHVLSCSDEWFAPASDLLKVPPAQSMKGQFGPAGALFDGWETRRHNSQPYDWVILRLGPKAGAFIKGFDVDTANFNGNEAPEVQIYAIAIPPDEEAKSEALKDTDPRWECVLPKTPCGPSSRHLFVLTSPPATHFTHIKLHMIPDGGIARFRVYGNIPPPPLGLGFSEHATPETADAALNVVDLAHVMNGGRVVYTSDQHFGVGANLLLPGRGKDMGDGWETKRSRSPGHKDFVVIKLGEAGLLNYAEIDTAHFLGNFPESVELHACHVGDSMEEWPVTAGQGEEGEKESGIQWTLIAPRAKMGPGKQHFLPLQAVEGKPYTHVKVTMHPDGGIKRVRIVGRRAAPLSGRADPLPPIPFPDSRNKAFPQVPGASDLTPAKAAPLTTDAFVPYGSVIGLPSSASCAANSNVLQVNQDTAKKFVSQAPVLSSYQTHASVQAETSIHLYRCTPFSLPLGVKVLERHQFTTQAFFPMTPAAAASTGQEGYLVIVALNGKDDKPDLSTLTAFHAQTTQGISYHPGVWHHPMVALGSAPTDFACVVNESKTAPELNCDEILYDAPVALFTV